MDVQTENVDPPPGEAQPSGKIRKGFKLFGKRKPGNIFSIRSKGDGNNKSPVIRSKTLDGLSDTAAPDLEQEADKEKRQEGSPGEKEQADEEPLGEDGVLAAAHARTSISSASSAKSLSFLTLLRGGRRGCGDRRVHTVSQPVGRQRRGLKGLFGNVKFRSKDKEDKEEAPPSPLLMSSRANSVEIIKEDLTLTPKSQPRSLDSPETESGEPTKSLTTPDEGVTSPSERVNVNGTDEPISEPPLVPGDTSLSSLLADISSLLTFDSITGGGDIMADVEAEWGKASSAISGAVSEVVPSSSPPLSKPIMSSPLTSTSRGTAAMAKPCSVAVPATTPSQSFTPLTKTTSTSSPTAKPSPAITTMTKSTTPTSSSVRLGSDSTVASDSIKNKSTPMTAATEPSATSVWSTNLSTTVTSSSSVTIKSTQSATSAATTAPPICPAAAVKAPSVSPALPSTASRLSSDTAAPPSIISSVIKPSPVATPPLAPAKTPPVTHSPVTFTQPPPTKWDSPSSSLNLQTSTSYKPSLSSWAADSKVPETVSSTFTATTKPSSSPPIIAFKMTTTPTPTTTSDWVSTPLSKPSLITSPTELNMSPPSPVTVPDLCPPFAPTRSQPSSAPVSSPSTASSDHFPPATKSTPAPVSPDKTLPAPTQTPLAVPTASPTPPALGQSPKAPPAPAQITHSVSKDFSPSAQIAVVSKEPPAPTRAPATSPLSDPVPWSGDAPASARMRASAQTSAENQLVHPSSTGTPGPKTEELHSESRASLQGTCKDRKTPQGKTSGLSKIPVVGGGRPGRLPVRESQHVNDEASRDPPTPVLEEDRPHLNSHDAGKGSKDRVGDVEPTFKHSPEESQPPHQQKALTSLPRDSKIPVKHSAQSHAASHIPQAKEPSRTKIPVSKVPVRRVANKPVPAGGSTQARK